MTRRTTLRIIRLRREGYKIWRIAELVGISKNEVLEILVDAGAYPLHAVEMLLTNERRVIESRKESLAQMRANRRKINQGRRIGGGNWRGR